MPETLKKADKTISDYCNSPIVTIITVTYNASDVLEKCIQSVINQDYKFIQFIIIDGASTDGTQEIIKRYEQHIDLWISEPDNGIYDAMNKGMKYANGYILFLGADDVLEPNVISRVAPHLSEDKLLMCNAFSENRIVKSKFNYEMLLQNKVHHQATFYPNCLRNNFYDTRFKICADYYLNLQLYNQGFAHKYLDMLIATCSDSGLSQQQYIKAHEEVSKIRKELNPIVHFWIDPFFRIRYKIKYLLKQLLRH